MTENQKEICLTLISHAKTKEEVLNAFMSAFPKANRRTVSLFIRKELKKKNEIIVSLRKKNYKEKFNVINDLLVKKEAGEIKSIYLNIVKFEEKKVDKSTYIKIVGKVNTLLKYRNKMRGKQVELLRFTPDYLKIEVRDQNVDLYGTHFFSIFDISASHCIRAVK